MKLKLLPCPFCGGEAKIDYGAGDYNRYEVWCTNCSAMIPDYEDNEEKLVERWNTRKDPNHKRLGKLKRSRVRKYVIKTGNSKGVELLNRLKNMQNDIDRLPKEINIQDTLTRAIKAVETNLANKDIECAAIDDIVDDINHIIGCLHTDKMRYLVQIDLLAKARDFIEVGLYFSYEDPFGAQAA